MVKLAILFLFVRNKNVNNKLTKIIEKLFTILYDKIMNSVLKGVLIEELERNLQKQRVFSNELAKYPKGSLVIVRIHGDQYLYRKYRDGKRIISIYIGPINSDEAKKAYADRDKYLKLKQDIKDLKEEEKKLRKAIDIYDWVWK